MNLTRGILVFAKAPVAGQVKTRLHTHLSPSACAELQRKLSLRILQSACESRLAPVELWCTPTTSHPFVRECVERFPIQLRLQRGSDLGKRMQHALNYSLRNYEQVVIIGTDCPLIDKAYLNSAFNALQRGRDVVIGPAEDGGYVLLGVQRFSKSLFDGISWGTNQVLKQTRAALQRLGWSWTELKPLWDVDRGDDLLRMRAHPQLAKILPKTQTFYL